MSGCDDALSDIVADCTRMQFMMTGIVCLTTVSLLIVFDCTVLLKLFCLANHDDESYELNCEP